MLEFLKKKQKEVPQKTTAELIEQIHEDFFTEVNKILESAKIMNSLDTQHQELINKSERLKRLGFVNSKEVQESEAEIKRLNKLREDNENKKSIIKAINYFSTRYPQYKFITEDSVKRICEKYGLVYSKIEHYVGSVPDRNLKHIEEFKIKDEDKCYIRETHYYSRWSRDNDIKYIDLNEYNRDKYKQQDSEYSRDYYLRAPLEIAAPVKDFDMQGKEVKDFKLKNIPIPDPIVLHPVLFERKKYYLIVTAWGPEASDIDVVNERMN